MGSWIYNRVVQSSCANVTNKLMADKRERRCFLLVPAARKGSYICTTKYYTIYFILSLICTKSLLTTLSRIWNDRPIRRLLSHYLHFASGWKPSLYRDSTAISWTIINLLTFLSGLSSSLHYLSHIEYCFKEQCGRRFTASMYNTIEQLNKILSPCD